MRVKGGEINSSRGKNDVERERESVWNERVSETV